MKNVSVTFNELDYGGGFMVHNWTLNVTTKNGEKNFWLGQDAKFCSRVLGMSPSYVIDQIGGSDLKIPKIQKALGKFIVEHLELTDDMIDKLEPWELSCQ